MRRPLVHQLIRHFFHLPKQPEPARRERGYNADKGKEYEDDSDLVAQVAKPHADPGEHRIVGIVTVPVARSERESAILLQPGAERGVRDACKDN